MPEYVRCYYLTDNDFLEIYTECNNYFYDDNYKKDTFYYKNFDNYYINPKSIKYIFDYSRINNSSYSLLDIVNDYFNFKYSIHTDVNE